jgi:hypothetical protein
MTVEKRQRHERQHQQQAPGPATAPAAIAEPEHGLPGHRFLQAGGRAQVGRHHGIGDRLDERSDIDSQNAAVRAQGPAHEGEARKLVPGTALKRFDLARRQAKAMREIPHAEAAHFTQPGQFFDRGYGI